MHLRAFVALSLIVVCPAIAHAQSDTDDRATVTADVGKHTVAPDDPTVNTVMGQSVLLRVVRDDKPVNESLVRITVEDQVFQPGKGRVLRFFRCNQKTIDKNVAAAARFDPSQCPRVLPGAGGAANVFIDDGVLPVRVEAGTGPAGDPFATTESMTFPISIVHRYYGLAWSGGFTFFDVRDEEYRLEPIARDDGNGNALEPTEQRIVRIRDGEVPYKLSAYANYMGPWSKSIGLAFGVGVDVPVESLSAMVGLTFAFRTHPIADSMHITAGLAYTRHKELLSEYRDTMRVPVGVAAQSFTSDRSDIGPFVAVTFRFFGGSGEQFKVVYSGDNK